MRGGTAFLRTETDNELRDRCLRKGLLAYDAVIQVYAARGEALDWWATRVGLRRKIVEDYK